MNNLNIRKVLLATAIVLGAAILPAQAADLKVTFADAAWTGKAIPNNQHCSLQGGHGASPALKVAGIPAGAVMIIVEYDDDDYQPLSYDGGHGVLGFKHDGGPSATLVSVPGETGKMPAGVTLVQNNRAMGSFSASGYLPPCSGGRDHAYYATVKAQDAKGDTLAEARVKIGNY